jgi:ABC-type polysaccharide/polyol phosphate transport system ATPase subunit
MTTAVQFQGVSKRFILHHQRSRTLREAVLGRFERGRDTGREELWALRDVSFDVEPGDCLGIIGANGSGKSAEAHDPHPGAYERQRSGAGPGLRPA